MAHISRRIGADGRPRYVVRWRPWRGSPREHSRTFYRAADAERFLANLRRGVPPGDRRPFREALAKWQESRRARGLRETTLALEEQLLRRHVLPVWADVPLGRITPAMLEDYLAGMLEAGYSRSTVASVWRLTKAPIEHATLKLQWLERSPARGVTLAAVAPRDPALPPRHLEPWEVEAMCRVAGHWEPLIRFMYATGARVGEVCALRCADFSGDSIRIRATVRMVGGRRSEGPAKTAKARRTIALPADTAAMLAELVADRPPEAHLFVGPRGGLLTPTGIRRVFLRVLAEAGIAHASPHALRHGHAALLLSHGAPLQAVSERLGHSDVTVTGRTYGHLLAHVDRSIADSFTDWVAASPRDTAQIVPLKRR